jgi:hypothetical protein
VKYQKKKVEIVLGNERKAWCTRFLGTAVGRLERDTVKAASFSLLDSKMFLSLNRVHS